MMIMNFFTSIVILKKGIQYKTDTYDYFWKKSWWFKNAYKHIFKSVSTMFLFYFKSKII